MRTIALISLLSCAFAACGDDGSDPVDATPYWDAPAEPDAALLSFPVQIITADCAPNDGPALRVVLAGEIDGECRATETGTRVEITVFVGAVTPPETIEFSNGDPMGWGNFCVDETCLAIMSGSLHFETFTSGDSASGTWLLRPTDGVIEGAFDAVWCDPTTPILCG